MPASLDSILLACLASHGALGHQAGMQARHVPKAGPRYWTALCVASVFGANMGDFASHTLHLGHARGLVPLAVLFALTLAWERRTRTPREPGGTEAFYWTAIVILRTAATNLGDLATHDFALSYPWVICGLAVLLGLAAFASSRQRLADQPGGVPATTAIYWTAMLLAGTLGTAGGDYVADALGLGVGPATIALGAVVALLLALRGLGGWVNAATYWMSVAAIRTAGTTLGDYTAFRHGLGLGLPLSTAATGAVFVGVLLAWPEPGRKGRLFFF